MAKLTAEQTRQLTGMVVPVYFDPAVPESQVKDLLEDTFADHSLYCDVSHTLVVVDQGTAAEQVVRDAGSGSPLEGVGVLTLDRNQGKTGAICRGLDRWLKDCNRQYVITRDCDGDHAIEDAPRIAFAAETIRHGMGEIPISVFGARPSLAQPMNWEREEWERLTNGVIADLVAYLAARKGRILDRRFWNGYPLDLQSGYRLYNRPAAELALASLRRLPDERDVYFLACEVLPFIEISLQRGVIGQVQRSTLVEQPVSSYARQPLPLYYGRLLAYLGDVYSASGEVLQLFDNHLVSRPAFFSQMRDTLLECRRMIQPDAPGPLFPAAL